ncbi:hypothetical protein H0H92_005014 [Tricholoma furcatifolium]|nr:hypothetical protein H0H92_005014 [Tricholoma furcatifolium]
MSLPKETEKLMTDPAPGIAASPHEDNLRYFDVMMEGPNDSPFQGGLFKLELFLPEDYPMAPPKVRFLTKIYHPNIGVFLPRALRPVEPELMLLPVLRVPADKLGRICLDILKDKWSPALQIRTVLLSIQALLSAPNPDDPLATDVAKHYKENELDAQNFSMTSIDSDVSYALLKEALALYKSSDLEVVLNLASTCRVIRQAALSVLFSNVHWPHGNKYDDESGLLFFPATLWPYFKHFQLLWPEDWPEACPPRWGDRYYVGGDYNPRHIDKLVAALPAMPLLSSFYLNCPFYPPNSLLNALTQCRGLRDLSFHETPMSISMSPRVPAEFHLDRLAIVPVAEAVRIGEGPFDARYTEHTYHTREYRKKYKNDILARRATSAFLFEVGKTPCLRHVQLSADLCTLEALAEHDWPVMETLILTGHAPRENTELLDLLAKMPVLRELRLLFAKTKGEPGLRILPEDVSVPTARGSSPKILGQLKHLAVSNACILDNVFHFATGLERLAILAIIDQPRVPIALNRAEIDKILADMEVGQRAAESRLLRLRIMIEDKVNPDLCAAIARRCPQLEALEIELCGYHDGKDIHAWAEFSDAFAPFAGIRELRICIQFPEFDEMDPYEPWRAARTDCALYLAQKLPRLQRVGFEYRKRTGTHRFEDNWLEFDVERDGGGGDGAGDPVALKECSSLWYSFPDVWFPVPAQGSGL